MIIDTGQKSLTGRSLYEEQDSGVWPVYKETVCRSGVNTNCEKLLLGLFSQRRLQYVTTDSNTYTCNSERIHIFWIGKRLTDERETNTPI